MKIFKSTLNYDFISKRKLAFSLSAIVILICLVSIFTRGLNLGVDFTGGTLIEIGYQQDADLNQIRSALSNSEFNEAVVQHFGTNSDVLIRVAPKEGLTTNDVSNRVLALLSGAELRRVEFVGPQVGEELTEDGGIAMLIALFCILIYVSLRFEKRFALGAVAALIHDVIIVIGFFSILGIEFDLQVLAAVLAVIGYSLNDTIVIFDRIRENFVTIRKRTTEEVMNISINQTMSRTIITGLTTLLVLIALYIFGGELIKPFSLALIVGIVVGTYSSIYVASTAALSLGVSKEDLMPVEKEGADIDSTP